MPPAVERAGSFTFAGCRLMLFLGGPPDRGPGAVGVVSPGLVGGVDAEGEGDRFVHDQLFRGEVRGGGREFWRFAFGVPRFVDTLGGRTIRATDRWLVSSGRGFPVCVGFGVALVRAR